MSYTNDDSFPVSNSSWLTLMCMQTIQSKKETNYHSYNYCILFCSSMASVIAFREKTIIRKRQYGILMVQQFPYIPLTPTFLLQYQKIERPFLRRLFVYKCVVYKRRYLLVTEEPHTSFSFFGKENAFVDMMYDFVMCTTRL